MMTQSIKHQQQQLVQLQPQLRQRSIQGVIKTPVLVQVVRSKQYGMSLVLSLTLSSSCYRVLLFLYSIILVVVILFSCQSNQHKQLYMIQAAVSTSTSISKSVVASTFRQRQHQQQIKKLHYHHQSTTIDFSYQYNIRLLTILATINEQLNHQDSTIATNNNYDNNNNTIVTIDISNLNLKDSNFQKIIESIFVLVQKQYHDPKSTNKVLVVKYLNLYSRMNSLSYKSVLYLLEKYLQNSEDMTTITTIPVDNTKVTDKENNHLNQTIDTATATATATEPSTSNGTQSKTIKSNMIQRIEKLDLSQNDLRSTTSTTGSSSTSRTKLDSFQQFRTIIEQLISINNKCPSEIILNNCCITSSICRSIGKGLTIRYENYIKSTSSTTTSSTVLTHDDDDKIHGSKQQQQQQHQHQHQLHNDTKLNTNDYNSTMNEDTTGSTYNSYDNVPKQLSLVLCNNKNIGDAGIVAIAAAVRQIFASINDNSVLLYRRHYDNTKTSSILSSSSKNTTNIQQQQCIIYGITIFNKLDVSACNIGDLGIQALALAFDECTANPSTTTTTSTTSKTFVGSKSFVNHLTLSYNKITDYGIIMLGKTLENLYSNINQQNNNIINNGKLFCLDVSGNVGITDNGLISLLRPVQKGCINHLILRSCSITADGTEVLGKILRKIIIQQQKQWTVSSNNNNNNNVSPMTITIDLSGNALGVLRGKKVTEKQSKNSKQKSSGSGSIIESTSFIKSSMSFLRNTGIVGTSSSTVGRSSSSTLESDDEHEDSADSSAQRNRDNENNNDDDDDDSDPSKGRCGLKSLSNAFTQILQLNDQGILKKEDNVAATTTVRPCTIHISLRRTFCDIAGADALAYMIVYAKEHFMDSTKIIFDLQLNPILEDTMIQALQGNNDEILYEMSDRHEHSMTILRDERNRRRRNSTNSHQSRTTMSSSPSSSSGRYPKRDSSLSHRDTRTHNDNYGDMDNDIDNTEKDDDYDSVEDDDYYDEADNNEDNDDDDHY